MLLKENEKGKDKKKIEDLLGGGEGEPGLIDALKRVLSICI